MVPEKEKKMINSTIHSLLLVAVVAGVTILIRFLPFLVFHRGTPGIILYLGKVLPYSIMGMLVVYCLKNMSFLKQPFGIPEVISVLLVVVLHKWKHNTLLSIGGGTLCYMMLIQMVF